MIFSGLASGSSVFLDANTLIYHFTGHPTFGPACTQLLERIENNDLVGLTSAHVVSEMAHRLMTIEASVLFNRTSQGIVAWLRRNPSEVQRLQRYRQAIDEMNAVPVQVLAVTGPLVSRAADFSRQFGLLSNDALIITIMLNHGLMNLASGDADFHRIPGITRYAPV